MRTLYRCSSWPNNQVQVTGKGCVFFYLVCQRRGPPFTSSPKPIPLCVCLAVWYWEEMGGNQSKNTVLECMIKNFEKGFNGD
jgi:hypothetical protein